MMPVALIDTGPLTALLNPNDEWHTWASAAIKRFRAPLLTSEPVLSEVSFLLRRDNYDSDELFALAEKGIIRVGIHFEEQRSSLRRLMTRYQEIPMSLADAMLVRLSELHRDCRVLTLDADFLIYRRHGNKNIPLLMPDRA